MGSPCPCIGQQPRVYGRVPTVTQQTVIGRSRTPNQDSQRKYTMKRKWELYFSKKNLFINHIENVISLYSLPTSCVDFFFSLVYGSNLDLKLTTFLLFGSEYGWIQPNWPVTLHIDLWWIRKPIYHSPQYLASSRIWPRQQNFRLCTLFWIRLMIGSCSEVSQTHTWTHIENHILYKNK